MPVAGLLVRSWVTEKVRRPSCEIEHPQHSVISCCESKTYTIAQRGPPVVPTLVACTVASGVAAALLLKKVGGDWVATVRLADPVCPFKLAEITTAPTAFPAANPAELILTRDEFAEDHVVDFVRSCVLPSLN